MFETKFVEKIKTHILCSTTVFLKILPLTKKIEKYGTKDRSDKGKGKGNGKAIPLQAWTGAEGSRRLGLTDFKIFRT